MYVEHALRRFPLVQHLSAAHPDLNESIDLGWVVHPDLLEQRASVVSGLKHARYVDRFDREDLVGCGLKEDQRTQLISDSALMQLKTVVIRLVDGLQHLLNFTTRRATHAQVVADIEIRDTPLAGLGSGDMARCPVKPLRQPVGRPPTFLTNTLERSTNLAPTPSRLKFTHTKQLMPIRHTRRISTPAIHHIG